MLCVERARYVTDLGFIAQPRPPGTTHWQLVQDLCADRLAELGYSVERHDYGSGVNVIGTRAGSEPTAPSVLVSAHYDSVAGCAGADDNASGAAGLLETARVLAMGNFRRNLIMACWDEEERGLIGSEQYADRARARGEGLAAVYDYEMIGYRSTVPGSQTMPDGFDLIFAAQARELARNEYRADFVALVGDRDGSGVAMAHVAELGRAVGLPTTVIDLPGDLLFEPLLSDLTRSDHASFWAAGYPGIMITDTSEFRYDRYHCGSGPDEPSVLDPDFSVQVIQVTLGSAARMAEVQ